MVCSVRFVRKRTSSPSILSMMQLSAGVEFNGTSPLMLSVRIFISFLCGASAASQCRTFAVLYHDDTSAVATEILQQLQAPFFSINVDDENPKTPKVAGFGSQICNICITKNLRASHHQRGRTINRLNRQSTNYYLMVVVEKITEKEISDFFYILWTEHRLLPAVAFLLGETVQVYTHFPFKKQFAVKVDELHPTNVTQMTDGFCRYFLGKANNLENATINAYIPENIPKVFRLPSKYRRFSKNFYFGGRDGFVANYLESTLNVRWNYKITENRHMKSILPFPSQNRSINTDLFGERINFDDNNPPNVEYRQSLFA